MKYYKTSRFAKIITSTGFISITACLLIALGAIGWFTLSRSNERIETPSENNSNQEYNDNGDSYIENTEPDNTVVETPAADVNESVNDIPYDSDTNAQESEKPAPQEQNYVLPIAGNISKGYSDSALQHSATYGDMRLHIGVDILCEKGSNIKSVGSGTVKSVFDDANYGKVIVISYDDDISVKYCGMDSANVKENDKVATGDIIGTSGEIPSECADNPHLHIEVYKNDENVSPLEALGLE